MPSLQLTNQVLNRPLTAAEFRRGRALRLVGLWRNAAGTMDEEASGYIAVALLLSRVDLKVPDGAMLKLCDRHAIFARGSVAPICVHTLLVEGVEQPSKEAAARVLFDLEEVGAGTTQTWHAYEYQFELAADVERMVLRVGTTTEQFDELRKQDLLSDYGFAVMNASVDDQYQPWLEGQRKFLESLPVPKVLVDHEDGAVVEATEGDERPEGDTALCGTHPLTFSLVVPLYQTPPAYLKAMIDSVLAQTYEHWQLILVNGSPDDEAMNEVLAAYQEPADNQDSALIQQSADERLVFVNLERNEGIVGNTNAGIAHASGDYVCFFDHDDLLEPAALAAYARAIQDAAPHTPALLYCDEDNTNENSTFELPLFKPALNMDLLECGNYIIHMLAIKHSVLDLIELSDDAVNGAQDYDLTLKVIDACGPESVCHVPYVLYHWRQHSGSTAANPDSKNYAQEAGRLAVERHLHRKAAAWGLKRPSQTAQKTAEPLIGSVARTDHNFEYCTRYKLPRMASLTVTSTGGLTQTTRASLQVLKAKTGCSVTLVRNLSPQKLAGFAMTVPDDALHAMLVLDADVDIPQDDLLLMAGELLRPEVFCVSPKIFDTWGLTWYAGTAVTQNGSLTRLLTQLPPADGGHVGRTMRPYDALVVSSGCCLLRRGMINVTMGEFTSGFPAYESMEYMLAHLCTVAYQHNYLNIFMPHAHASKLEQQSYLRCLPARLMEAEATRYSRHFEKLLADGDPSMSCHFAEGSPYLMLKRDEFLAASAQDEAS